MTKSTINEVEFPAYKIYRPYDGRKFKTGDVIAVPYQSMHYGTMFNFYTLGTVIGCAVKNGEEPIEALERAKKLGHRTHWANQNGVCLHNGPHTQEQVPGFNLEDTIILEGREFRIARSPNNNIDLLDI